MNIKKKIVCIFTQISLVLKKKKIFTYKAKPKRKKQMGLLTVLGFLSGRWGDKKSGGFGYNWSQ